MADSAVNLGAGGNDFSGMSMDEALFGATDPAAYYRATRPSYDEEGMGFYFSGEGDPYPAERGNTGTRYTLMDEPIMEGMEGYYYEQSVDRGSPYAAHASPSRPELNPGNMMGRLSGSDVKYRYMEQGGEVEEMGIMGALFSPNIDLPSARQQNIVRNSGREGSEGSSMYYPEGAPTFETTLIEEYGYPDVEREIDYGTSTTAQMRAGRPRHDLPTYQELEDARAHVLQSALLAKQVGPETAEKFGGLAEFFDRRMPILGTATDADVVMDKRNNAFGAQLLKKAGVNASPQQITQMVDSAIFEQLDRVLGRKPGERRFKSPDTGIDIFFPRDKYGYFDINRYD